MKIRDIFTESRGDEMDNKYDVVREIRTYNLNYKKGADSLIKIRKDPDDGGWPDVVEYDFLIYNLTIKSLVGCPTEVGMDFDCRQCVNLKNLKGGPRKVGGDYFFDYCINLVSLEGAPEYVGKRFHGDNNAIKSIVGAPAFVGADMSLHSNKIPNLQGIHKIVKHAKSIDLTRNPIKSHVLGLLLINGLERVELDNQEVLNILTRAIKEKTDILSVQEEMIQAGLREFARI